MAERSQPATNSTSAHMVAAVCQVVFDVDIGNKVEAIHPVEALTPEELADVAFHSFPDSMSLELRAKTSVRDCSFFFRIKRRPAAAYGPPQFLYGFVFCRQRQDERLRRGGEQKSVVVLSELPLSSVLAPLSRFLGPLVLSYGAEALEQVYEEVCCWPPPAWGAPMTLPLGELEAITAHISELSTLPLLSAAFDPSAPRPPAGPSQGGSSSPRAADEQQARLATPAAEAAAPAAPAAGPSAAAIEEQLGTPGCPEPDPEALREEECLLAETDDATGLPLCLLPQAYGQQELVEGPFSEMDAYTPLRHVMHQLWGLWELLLLGEPLLVAAPTPAACSGAVAALISLLTPCPYAADYRPYLTIQDPCFAPLASGSLPTPKNGLPCLLGVTNLYFIKALPAWPNVLSTGYAAQQAQQQGGSGGTGGEEGSNGSEAGGGMWRSESGQSVASNSGSVGGGRRGSRLGQALRRRAQGAQALLSEAQDALWMSYKPCTRPDKEVLRRLAHPTPSDPPEKVSRAAMLNSMLLRRHFQELTQALLFPLLPYISPAPPPAAPHSPSDLQSPPPLPPVDPAAILRNLGDRAGAVPDILLRRFGSNKTLVQFYQQFLESPNLLAWLQTRRAVAEQWQARAWHEAWWEAGGPLTQAGSAHMGEVVAVEAFFQLEQELQLAEDSAQLLDKAEALRAQLRSIFASMPPDLQRSLLLSPRRAAWLCPASDG